MSPLLLIAAPLASAGTTVRVPEDRPNLASALNSAGPDDAIRLGPGEHNLPSGLVLDTPIVGVGPATTLVVNGTGEPVVSLDGGSVAITRLTLDAGGERAVECTNGGMVVLRDVILTHGGADQDGLGGGLVYLHGCTAVPRCHPARHGDQR
ncbi:MAG: hypothetical protein H6734_16025 [Alphaproteobacteria bacterium]|nr:hypothetical protein [Alphaproteobacteria bacterium]